MTDDQVNRIVEHLCEQLHVTIRLKGAQSEVFPPNVKVARQLSPSIRYYTPRAHLARSPYFAWKVSKKLANGRSTQYGNPMRICMFTRSLP
jgi:hypothetical protein